MKCKNCGVEIEKGNFCSECGFPFDEQKKSRSQEAYETLQDVKSKVDVLFEDKKERDAKHLEIEERKKKSAKEENELLARKHTRSIIPDLF
jgi:ribosomal protein L37E